MADAAQNGERLGRFLARAGVASRRHAEELIRQGRVSVNGATIRDPGTRVLPQRDAVRVDGRRVRLSAPVYILFHKPRGMLCTMEDPLGRPCVGDLLSRFKGRPVPVGRLDADAEGLLLCTNDGDLAYRMLHPRFRVRRVYHVKVKGVPSDLVMERLRRGIPLEGKKTAPAAVSLLKRAERNAWVRMTLYEGRNRQIKRMFERFGHPVRRLKRVALGPLSLAGLSAGAYRRLRPEEIARLKQVAGGVDKARESS